MKKNREKLLSDSEAQKKLVLGHQKSREFLVKSLATMSPGRMVMLGGDNQKTEVIMAEVVKDVRKNSIKT